MRVILAALFAALASPAWAAQPSITDGGTLVLDNVTFALSGIEAPQTDQTCIDEKGAVWTCGIDARDRLREHVGKRDVRCTDKGADSILHGRRFGECFAGDDKTSLNQWMVQQGWALNAGRAAKHLFKAEQDEAKTKRLGLWKGCFVAPQDLRRVTISTAALLGGACPSPNNWRVRETLFPEYPRMPAECDVKGRTVMRSEVAGYRGIYHLRSCRSYERTKQAHRWFCSEDEAKAAGFRKSYTC